MKKRQRNRALKTKKLQLDRLHPRQQAGITVGASAEEALREHPSTAVTDGVQVAAHLAEVPTQNRVPVFRAYLKDSLDSVWVDEPTGRVQRDVVVLVNPEVREALRTGWMCLRCYEPQSEAFPADRDAAHLPGCTYSIYDRQAVDVRLEFRGEEHVGPAKPITVYLEEQDARMERRQLGLA